MSDFALHSLFNHPWAFHWVTGVSGTVPTCIFSIRRPRLFSNRSENGGALTIFLMIISPRPSSVSNNSDGWGLPFDYTAALHLYALEMGHKSYIFYFTLLYVNKPRSLELPPHDLSRGLDEMACWARFVLMHLARPLLSIMTWKKTFAEYRFGLECFG